MHRRGFSLIEVLCAILLATTGLAALTTLTRTASRQDATAELTALLESALRARLDLACHRPYRELAAAAEGLDGRLAATTPPLPASLQGLVSEESATVTQVEDGLARVTVRIAWALPGAPQASARTLAVVRLVARDDVSFEAVSARASW